MKKLQDMYRFDDSELAEAFNRIAVEISMQKKKNGYKSYAICGSDQGIGSTTVAINLAISTALTNWNTLLIDSDLRKRNELKRLNEGLEGGLSDYLSGNAAFNTIVYSTDYGHLSYIPCGKTLDNPISLLCSNRLDEFIKEAEKEYDFILWDTSAVNRSVDTKIIASKSDATLIVAAQNQLSDDLKMTQEILNKAGANILGVIANRIDRSEYENLYKGASNEKKWIWRR